MTLEVRAHENFLRRSWEFVGILPTLPNRIPLPNHTVSQFTKNLPVPKVCLKYDLILKQGKYNWVNVFKDLFHTYIFHKESKY